MEEIGGGTESVQAPKTKVEDKKKKNAEPLKTEK